MKSEIYYSGCDYAFYFITREDKGTSTVDFISYRIEGRTNKIDKIVFSSEELDFEPLYMKIEGMSNDYRDLTTEIEEAEKFVTGTIKWDGCSHLNFPSYMHFCSAEEAESLGKLLADVYREAGRFVNFE